MPNCDPKIEYKYIGVRSYLEKGLEQMEMPPCGGFVHWAPVETPLVLFRDVASRGQ